MGSVEFSRFRVIHDDLVRAWFRSPRFSLSPGQMVANWQGKV